MNRNAKTTNEDHRADDQSFHIILMANNKMKWKMVQTTGYHRDALSTHFSVDLYTVCIIFLLCTIFYRTGQFSLWREWYTSKIHSYIPLIRLNEHRHNGSRPVISISVVHHSNLASILFSCSSETCVVWNNEEALEVFTFVCLSLWSMSNMNS